MVDALSSILVPLGLSIAGGLSSGIFIYIGVTRSSNKTIDMAISKVEAKAKGSATIKRLMKIAEMSDSLFGDEKAIAQITRFFKEAGDLVSSPEAKTFFTHATKTLKQFSEPSKDEKPLIDLPEKPKTLTN